MWPRVITIFNLFSANDRKFLHMIQTWTIFSLAPKQSITTQTRNRTHNLYIENSTKLPVVKWTVLTTCYTQIFLTEYFCLKMMLYALTTGNTCIFLDGLFSSQNYDLYLQQFHWQAAVWTFQTFCPSFGASRPIYLPCRNQTSWILSLLVHTSGKHETAEGVDMRHLWFEMVALYRVQLHDFGPDESAGWFWNRKWMKVNHSR